MNKKTILVVEDQPDYSYVLSYWLESALEGKSFELITARDGMEALKLIRSHLPDLIIMDIILPRLDGLQVCRMIKFDKKFEHIPVVMVSSIPGEDVQERAKQVKANYFFAKPVNMDEFIQAIKQCL